MFSQNSFFMRAVEETDPKEVSQVLADNSFYILATFGVVLGAVGISKLFNFANDVHHVLSDKNFRSISFSRTF